MKKTLAALLAASALVAGAPVARSDTDRLSLVRVQVDSPEEAAFVASTFDETHNYVPGYVEVLLWPGDAAELAAHGYDYEVVAEDIYARDVAAAPAATPVVELPGPDRSDYRRLGDYVSEMKQLAKENPSYVKLLKLPHKSLEGRTIHGLEIGANVRRADGRPVYYIDGIHHAREWPAAEYPMIFAHLLVEHRNVPEVQRLLRGVRVMIVPIVNVDGFDYSRESVLSAHQAIADRTSMTGSLNGFEGYWRKNRRSLTGVTVPHVHKNPDAYGVDVNRNYGFKWGDNQGGSSSSQTSTTYRGEAPFSEPETKNVRHLLSTNNVVSVITNHTYGRLVLRPWGDTYEDAPDERLLTALGGEMAQQMGGYQNIKSIDLYATTGTTEDWAYGALGALSYTFEHGTAFHPPYADSVGKDVGGVMNAFYTMAKATVHDGWHSIISGRVVDGAGRPVEADLKIVKRFSSPQWPNNPAGIESIKEVQKMSMRAAADGAFTWHLSPSTRPHVQSKGQSEAYSLEISAPGLVSRTINVVVRRGQHVRLGTIRL